MVLPCKRPHGTRKPRRVGLRNMVETTGQSILFHSVLVCRGLPYVWDLLRTLVVFSHELWCSSSSVHYDHVPKVPSSSVFGPPGAYIKVSSPCRGSNIICFNQVRCMVLHGWFRRFCKMTQIQLPVFEDSMDRATSTRSISNSIQYQWLSEMRKINWGQ